MPYRIDINRCIKCGACVGSCPMEAIELDETELYVINPNRCIDCGTCDATCPNSAISGD